MTFLTLFSCLSLGLSLPLRAADCLGPASGAKGYMIYLHGFEPLTSRSSEETENRRLLERLAREMNYRIALPRGVVCPKQRVCWPAKDPGEVLRTFTLIQNTAKGCWQGNQPYTLLGFSNGGFYAFKLYKAHRDARLKYIISAGASGLWDPKKDKANPLSQFQLMIGDKDITLNDASKFAERFRDVDSGFTLFLFNGGHRLDYDTLVKVIKAQK